MRDERLRYLHYDVFTSTPFEGNQLAVFPEPAGLSDDDMQTITREMNFSECTFIFPPEAAGTDRRMRIFTPHEELPMAGHPTIGSTFALVQEGVIAPGQREFVFGLNIGPTPVSLEWADGALTFAWMTQPLPTFGGRIEDRTVLATALSVERRDLAADLPAEFITCGVPYVFVPMTTRQAVDRVAVNRTAYVACLSAAGIEDVPVFPFTLDRAGAAGDETVYSRMLAPGFGIAEDPATGSANGPLGCYLAVHSTLSDAALDHFVSLQGVAMKRPSRLHVSIARNGRQVTRVRVGGQSVLVGEGTLRVR
jgi:trans-2,3-dihydro-3-hydroxyanthranilate isomerase